MNLNIEYAPLIPWSFILGFAVLALGFVLLMFFRNIKGASLRAFTALLLLATLANPTLRNEERQPLSDIAVVVVDESQSQNFGSRNSQTKKALADIKSRISTLKNLELRIISVKSGLSPDTDGTRLFTSLNRAISDIPKDRFAGAILITDGQVHDVPQNLGTINFPIHTLLSGSKKESDRRIVIDRSPNFGIVGQNQTLQFHVEDSNQSRNSIPVTVKIPGEVPRIVDVVPGEANDLEVALGHAGQNLVELSVENRENELTFQNNRSVAVIKGIRDRLRVLLVSGQPHPGERSWRNLLKADASVDLVHFTILRPPEKQDGTPTKELSLIAFPTRELFIEKLDQFDLVIFDRYRRQAILPDSYLANVAEYVRKGGALLVASGPDFADPEGLYSTPLSDILAASPTGAITETPFKPALTTSGQRHPVTQDLPGANADKSNWGRWFRLIDTVVSPEAQTLMSGPDAKPLLVLSRVEQGRVAQLLSDQAWLWARGYEGGGPQTELLRRIAHWLMKEPDLEEESLTARQLGSEIIIERRSMNESVNPVKITSPSGKFETLTPVLAGPGLFTTRFPAQESGLHSLDDGTLQAAAAIGSADAKETLDIRATADKLDPVAKATGGGIAWLEDGMPVLNTAPAGKLMAGAGWLNLRANGVYRVTAVRSVSLFSTLLSLALLLIAASAMWWQEGR